MIGIRPYYSKGAPIMTDGEIIALLNNRDETAVVAIKERFGGLCFRLASNILSDRRDAEECVSSVYFKLWSGIPPASPNDLTAYVAKTARNEALMRYRRNASKRNRAASVSLDELEECITGGSGTEEDLNAELLAKAVEEFIRVLPAEQRGVFMRRYWFFDSAKAIAGSFGLTEDRVNALLAKTRRQLRRYLIKEEYIYE
ncbi:MAG: sigma-70 family RNA polymerase sigma factor [Clostridiales bacterium]|nr:sigma-70 family RNA polymerase sigma factor [Clostridiales bacterium]